MAEKIKTATILYVEDEEKVREGYTKPIKRCAKELFTASNGKEGLELFKKHNPDIVVTDIKMPKMNGIDMVKAIKEINPEVKVIFTSAHSESEYLLNAIELHADGYFLKPVPSKLLKSRITSISKMLLLEKINAAQQIRIQEQEILLQNIIDTDENITIVSDCHRISFANKAFLDFFGLDYIDQFYINHDSFLEVFEQESGFLHQELINDEPLLDEKDLGLRFYNLIQSTKDSERVASIIDKQGNVKHFLINISLMDQINALYLVTLTNITEITIQKTMAQTKVNIDELTGAYNRNKFEEVFEYEISKAEDNGLALSIAILDIDYFKNYNDKYGHLVGDEILRLLVQEVKKHIRKTDLFARWGGEEFVLIFEGTDIDNAVKISNNLRKKIAVLENQPAGKITVSFGVTQYIDGDDKKSIFSRCDDALYLAKKHGRNCVKVL